jgi:hypothetical protein
MGLFHCSISTDGSGDGTNLVGGNPTWDGIFTGLIMGIFIDDNGAAAGADVTISEPEGLKRTILTATDVNADTTYNPQNVIQTNAAVATTQYNPFYVESNNLKVTVAQGGATVTAAIKVTVLILEC